MARLLAMMEKKESDPAISYGTYGKVALVEGSEQERCNDDLGLPQAAKGKATAIWQRMQAMFAGKSAAVDEVITGVQTAHLVLDHHQIGQVEDKALLERLKRGTDENAANMIACIVQWHKVHRNPGSQYDLGLSIADLLEVASPELAARLLKGISNPGVTDRILKGQAGLEIAKGKDLLPMSVEAFVLLPSETRHAILRTLVELGYKAQATALWKKVASNISQRNSPYSAVQLVYANLPGDEGGEKIAELMQDMQIWAEFTK